MLRGFLKQRRDAIVGKWFDLIVESYPADTSRFLKKEKDRFNNPVGHTFLDNMNGLFDELLAAADDKRISVCLDNIIRVRSIQDFSPREAVAFVFQLKKIIRGRLESERPGDEILAELPKLEQKIDEMALLAFQIYVRCREDLFEIRTRELRRRSDRLMSMVNAASTESAMNGDGIE
jgi:hypothetical protein